MVGMPFNGPDASNLQTTTNGTNKTKNVLNSNLRGNPAQTLLSEMMHLFHYILAPTHLRDRLPRN